MEVLYGFMVFTEVKLVWINSVLSNKMSNLTIEKLFIRKNSSPHWNNILQE